MQRLEVSYAVRYIYMCVYVYICVVRRQRVNQLKTNLASLPENVKMSVSFETSPYVYRSLKCFGM